MNADTETLRSLSTPQLIRHALDEAKLYAKAEVLHAKHELREELAAAKRGGILLGAASVLALCGLSALFVALAFALPLPAGWAVAAVGGALLALSGVLFLIGRRALPKKPLERTAERLKMDVSLAKERLA